MNNARKAKVVALSLRDQDNAAFRDKGDTMTRSSIGLIAALNECEKREFCGTKEASALLEAYGLHELEPIERHLCCDWGAVNEETWARYDDIWLCGKGMVGTIIPCGDDYLVVTTYVDRGPDGERVCGKTIIDVAKRIRDMMKGEKREKGNDEW